MGEGTPQKKIPQPKKLFQKIPRPKYYFKKIDHQISKKILNSQFRQFFFKFGPAPQKNPLATKII